MPTTTLTDPIYLIKEIDSLLGDYRLLLISYDKEGKRDKVAEVRTKMDGLLDRRIEQMKVRDAKAAPVAVTT